MTTPLNTTPVTDRLADLEVVFELALAQIKREIAGARMGMADPLVVLMSMLSNSNFVALHRGLVAERNVLAERVAELDGMTPEQFRREAAYWRNKWYEDDRKRISELDGWNRYEVEVEAIIRAFTEWGGADLANEMSPQAERLRGLLEDRPDRGVGYAKIPEPTL